MYLLKKKYVIKIIALSIGFAAVITGIFIQIKHFEKEALRKDNLNTLAILNNVASSVNKLENSFKKGLAFNQFDNEQKQITALSFNITNMLYLSNLELTNTAKWFSDLFDYSKTDMQDNDKNQKYFIKLSEANKLFINICDNYENDKDEQAIEELFSETKDKNYYNNVLYELENSYSLLNYQIISEQKDINDFAKTILRFPFTPQIFKGNYQIPKPITYFSSNSYANIFREGKLLERMSVETNRNITGSLSKTGYDSSKKILEKYAKYAENLTEVYSVTNESLLYRVFCPTITLNGYKIINYNEPLRIATSLYDSSLKAFDASGYLKNHSRDFSIQTEKLNTMAQINTTFPKEKIVSEHFIIKDDQIFREFKAIYDNQYYYCTLNTEGTFSDIFSQDEYMRRMGL